MKRTLCVLIFVSTVVYLLPAKADDDIPDWFLNPPEDPHFLYAVSTARSSHLRIAIRDACANGRHEIAQRIETRIRTQNPEKEPSSVMSQVLKGCKVYKQEVRREGLFYRVYVLMEIPIEETNLAQVPLRVHGYGYPQADTTTEKNQKLSAYLAAIADACREILAFQEVSVKGLIKDIYSLGDDNQPLERSHTSVSKSRVNGKIGNSLNIQGETGTVHEREEKPGEASTTLLSFNDWIKFEYAGHLILIRSTQTHTSQSGKPDVTTRGSHVEMPDIASMDINGIESALEESGIEIEDVWYRDDGLCKVTLLQSANASLETLDTGGIVPPPETSADQKDTPLLVAKVLFSEPSGNNTLDANETGHLTVIIHNKGEGGADEVEVKLTPETEMEGLTFLKSASIGRLEPQTETIVEFPIVASELIKSGQMTLTIHVTEGGKGIRAEPVRLTFMARGGQTKGDEEIEKVRK